MQVGSGAVAPCPSAKPGLKTEVADYWNHRETLMGQLAFVGLPTSAATETARRFALRVMLENRARLLESE